MQNDPRPLIVTMFSPRREFGYRFQDALITIPTIKQRYRLRSMGYHSDEEVAPDISHLNPFGVITSVATSLFDVSPILALGIPVVNISLSDQEGFMSLFTDAESTAKTVVRHAIATHFEKIVFLTPVGMTGQIVEQGAALQKHVLQAGLGYDHYSLSPFGDGMRSPAWKQQNADFVHSLTHEKERTLYFAYHDSKAVPLLHLMEDLGIRVPQQAGIIGRGNTCEAKMADIGLSSIEWPWLRLAEAAIKMLEDRSGDVRVKCGSIAVRGSTIQSSKNQHQWIIKTAEMIESHGHRGLTADKLAEYAGVSKSTLERHYKRLYGRSPSAAIRQVQLRKAETLLKETNMTIESIAHSVGFNAIRSFFRAFESEYGTTPGEWKKMRQ